MRWFLALALCLFIGSANAQMSGGAMFPGPGVKAYSSSYTGPGDVVSGAKAWWGLRAYNLASVGTKIANVCNSGDANCADVNSTASGDFDVATAQGAPLNCGGAGGTCTIKTLYDQTNGNNCTAATCNLTNATAANRPTLSFSCAGLGSGKACMTFDGSNDTLSGSNSYTSVSQPGTISSVANSTNTGAAQALFTLNGGGFVQQKFRNSANNTANLFGGNVLTATASDGSWHALQAVANGASSDMNVDGSANAGNGGTNAFVGSMFLATSNGTTGQIFTGTVVEVGIWPSAFTGTNSTNMSSNQHSYWGF